MLSVIDQVAEFVNSLPGDNRSKFAGHIPSKNAEELLSNKYYVYVLMYPYGPVFYVGKGTGSRIDAHESEARKGIQSYKCNVIRQIWDEGGQVIKQKVAYFDNEEDAYELEKLLIAFFGRKSLTNMTGGGRNNFNFDNRVQLVYDAPPSFGDVICAARIEMGLKQKDVALQIKKEDGKPISNVYLSEIECNYRNPPSDLIIEQLALVLGIDVLVLYFYAGRLPPAIRDRQVSDEIIVEAFRAFREGISLNG